MPTDLIQSVAISFLGITCLILTYLIAANTKLIKRHHRDRVRFTYDGKKIYARGYDVLNRGDTIPDHLTPFELYEAVKKTATSPTITAKSGPRGPITSSRTELEEALAKMVDGSTKTKHKKRTGDELFNDMPDYEETCIEAAQAAFDDAVSDDKSNDEGVIAALKEAAGYFRDDERERVVNEVRKAFSASATVENSHDFSEFRDNFTKFLTNLYNGDLDVE